MSGCLSCFVRFTPNFLYFLRGCKWHYIFNFGVHMFIAGMKRYILFSYVDLISCDLAKLIYSRIFFFFFFVDSLDFSSIQSCYMQVWTVLLISYWLVCFLFPFLISLARTLRRVDILASFLILGRGTFSLILAVGFLIYALY